MSVYGSTSTQQPAAICALKSPADAIHILEAVRLGRDKYAEMDRWETMGCFQSRWRGFLVYTESSDSLSPPPPDGGYQYPNGYYKKIESLIKQTYSTTMTHPVTGKVKKFHVVAYSSKLNPQGDSHNPLPLPHQLPLLANIKIPSGIWPEWEHRREADYARRTPVIAPNSTPVTAIASSESSSSAGHSHSHSHPPPPPPAPYSHRPEDQPYPDSRYYPTPPGYPRHEYGGPPPPLPPLPPSSTYAPGHNPNHNPTHNHNHAAHTQPTQSHERYHPYAAPRSYPAYSSSSPYPPPPDGYDDRDPIPGRTLRSPSFPPFRSYQDIAPSHATSLSEHQLSHPHSAPPGSVSNSNSNSTSNSNSHSHSHSGSISNPNQVPNPNQNPAPNQNPSQNSTRSPPRLGISAALDGVSSGGLTLPPLRMAIDDNARLPSPAASSNGMGKLSPRLSDGVGEDARQLGALGKTVF
ncbi:hypothetical protein EHS25_000219 [Saitozyma podzolica]|uniref:Uncharacterized protein n=1 Tax=Saitozyma podzolica TaxID=1890683 RepID=A0A427YVH1_9TREE|nr:hypothetical protein EHS25_000219 [Saitozyma podzolica]